MIKSDKNFVVWSFCIKYISYIILGCTYHIILVMFIKMLLIQFCIVIINKGLLGTFHLYSLIFR